MSSRASTFTLDSGTLLSSRRTKIRATTVGLFESFQISSFIDSCLVLFASPIGAKSPVDGRAIINYKGTPVKEPTTSRVTSPTFREQDLRNARFNNPGLGNETDPAKITKLKFEVGLVNGSPFFTINGTTFVPPTVPALLQILKGAKNIMDVIPSEHMIFLERDQLIEVEFTKPSKPPLLSHPFHLHGHSFDVIKSAGSDTINLENPVRRDVVTTVGGDTTIFRFRTDNPGPWFLHCQCVFLI